MDHYAELYDIAKTLLLETGSEELHRFLLDRAIAFTSADRGFIVVREQGSFQEKYQVHFDRSLVSDHRKRFSGTAVRKVIRSRQILLIEDLSKEPTVVGPESVTQLGSSSVLIAPLADKEEVFAVIYLERASGGAPFAENDRNFMKAFSILAAASFRRSLERENLDRLKRLLHRDDLAAFDFHGIVGRHPRMLRLLETVAQVAPSEATVLVRGETGTGKELVAEALHRNSGRRNQPFVSIHCGALPETLFEAELFGHRRGAFSGADHERKGRIPQAAGGTLFIDEVGEIPLASQAKLLRFLQSGEFQRLGSDRVERLDTRILAATHRDLEEMVRGGAFREDLFYRLNVIELEVPPLRDRKSDIPKLVDFFLNKFRSGQKTEQRFTPRALALLEAYDYPGNVRELAHLVERACVLARGPELDADLLPESLARQVHPPPTAFSTAAESFQSFSNEELKTARERATKQAVDEIERQYLDGLLQLHGGNITRSAKAAGMHRSYLHRLLARHRAGE